MLKVKSIHPNSTLREFTIGYNTTASVGPSYFVVPHDCKLRYIDYGMGIKTTSNRAFSVRNLTTSKSYLNSSTIMGSGAIGFVTKIGVCSSDAHTSGTIGMPFISAGSLLKVDWSATKGDCAFAMVFTRVEPYK